MSQYEENDEVLRHLADDGTDLTFPRKVDFSFVFPDKLSARRFAEVAGQQGYATAVEYAIDDEAMAEDEEVQQPRDPWDVTASKVIVPTCGNITGIEESLGELARRHGGRPDGWGFFTDRLH
jgi:hypothetical protein